MVILAVVVVVVAVVSVLVVGSRKRGCRSHWSHGYATSFSIVGVHQRVSFGLWHFRALYRRASCGKLHTRAVVASAHIVSTARLSLHLKDLRAAVRAAACSGAAEPITRQEVIGSFVGLVQIFQSLLYFLHALGNVFCGFFW